MTREQFWWCVFLVAQVPAVLLFRAAVLPAAEQRAVAVLAFMAAQLVLAGCVGAWAGQGLGRPIAWLVPLGSPLMLALGAGAAFASVAGAAYYLDLASHALPRARSASDATSPPSPHPDE